MKGGIPHTILRLSSLSSSLKTTLTWDSSTPVFKHSCGFGSTANALGKKPEKLDRQNHPDRDVFDILADIQKPNRLRFKQTPPLELPIISLVIASLPGDVESRALLHPPVLISNSSHNKNIPAIFIEACDAKGIH
jgi:hypothetical protein